MAIKYGLILWAAFLLGGCANGGNWNSKINYTVVEPQPNWNPKDTTQPGSWIPRDDAPGIAKGGDEGNEKITNTLLKLMVYAIPVMVVFIIVVYIDHYN